ncbi:hypothetical protein [Oceanobacillus sp. FSL H7-0719]|uniref:hypothetical protein n=1 Tax=Oceanobacillus sp. FSL H7-0719 TaxID=2954507 RepID=UPI003246A3A1
MDEKEIRLEEISDQINNYTPTKHLPVFEVYVTMFSILTAVMLFWFPDMLSVSTSNITNLYWLLLSIMPQFMWAILFFVAGMIKAIGLLVDNNATRIIGLILSAFIYIVFAICYAISFPTIGFVVFTCMSIFTLISIPMVKHTGVRD